MELRVLKNEEKRMNFILFLFTSIIPPFAFAYVMLFNNGCIRDAVVFIIPFVSILIRLFEKKLGKYAKYLYILIYQIGAVLAITIGNDGSFGALPESYFLLLLLIVPYYDINMVKVTAVSMLVCNVAGILISPSSYLLMRTIPIWVFLLLVYSIAVLTTFIIIPRTRKLFADVEAKEEQTVRQRIYLQK